MRATIIRKGHFNAAHRLHNPNWEQSKNEEIFGLCNSPNFHGHNYDLDVYLTGDIDPETGYIYNLKDLKNVIEREVEDRFDHKNLNLDCPEFATLMPSTENLAYVIHDILTKNLPSRFSIKVILWETPRNGAIYPPEG